MFVRLKGDQRVTNACSTSFVSWRGETMQRALSQIFGRQYQDEQLVELVVSHEGIEAYFKAKE